MVIILRPETPKTRTHSFSPPHRRCGGEMRVGHEVLLVGFSIYKVPSRILL